MTCSHCGKEIEGKFYVWSIMGWPLSSDDMGCCFPTNFTTCPDCFNKLFNKVFKIQEKKEKK